VQHVGSKGAWQKLPPHEVEESVSAAELGLVRRRAQPEQNGLENTLLGMADELVAEEKAGHDVCRQVGKGLALDRCEQGVWEWS
jgi:hypothetical protein